MADDSPSDWAHLAKVARERRTALGLRQADLDALGGPSSGTVRNIEQAARDVYVGRTFVQLERALRWKDGAVGRILRGEATPEDLDPSVHYPQPGEAAGPTSSPRYLGKRNLAHVPPAAVISGGGSVTAGGVPRPTLDLVAELVTRLASTAPRVAEEQAALEALYRLMPVLWESSAPGVREQARQSWRPSPPPSGK